MLLHWQFNTEPKCIKWNFVYFRRIENCGYTLTGITPQTCTARREPHYSSTATTSAQRSTSNTEAYRHKSTPHPTPQSRNSKQPRHNVSHPTPKHTDTSQHPPLIHNQELLKKSPRGVQRGRGFAAPLRFSFFLKKNTVRHSQKKQTPHSILKKVFPTSCYFT